MFVRLTSRNGATRPERPTIERVLDLIVVEPELNEFKFTTLGRRASTDASEATRPPYAEQAEGSRPSACEPTMEATKSVAPASASRATPAGLGVPRR